MRAIAAIAGAVALAAALAACGDRSDGTSSSAASHGGGTAPATTTTGAAARSRPRTIARNLDTPWGIGFLPGGDALVTERDGRILRIPSGGGRPRTVMRVPGVDAVGEAGLLGLAVSPGFERDRTVFVYYTTDRDNRIAAFRLGQRRLRPILTGLRAGPIHDGGRIAFGPDGKLYAGVGETGDTGLAQDRGSPNGKILRINPDGSIPDDNPFAGSPVWTLGHRNVQGLAWDRAGRLWATEFGQEQTDEVNLIRKGRNYGWPIVEGRGDTRGGRFTNPKVTWSPTSTSSPSGAAIAGSNLYVGALAGRTLWRIPLHGPRAGRPRALWRNRYGRIRTVVAAPGGRIWFTTSNRDGRGDPTPSDDRILSFRP